MMLYDSLGGISPANTLDIKLEKRHEVEETRPVEDTDDSDDSKLDLDRQNIAKRRSAQDISQDLQVESETYNAKGSLTRKIPVETGADRPPGSIMVVV